jgi:HSP20 family molecular chaperone IbpA
MSLFQSLVPSLNRAPARRDSSSRESSVPTVKPVYEIKETPDAYGVTVYLPGVAKDAVELTAEDGQFVISARRAWKQPEGWTALYRESSDAAYELVLSHDNVIDTEKVAAELRDGILRLSLPKVEAIKPRKIAVA